MAQIGHNGGPSAAEGLSWRKHCWTQARAALLPYAGFAEAYATLRAALPDIPSDRVILVDDTALEREWCAAGRLAAYLPADRCFG